MNKQEQAWIKEVIGDLKHCKEIGNIIFKIPDDEETINTIIEVLEKQIPKKPIEQSTDEKTHFKCICGSIQKTVYKNGYRMGAERAYCDRCGQAIDWRNEDEQARDK